MELSHLIYNSAATVEMDERALISLLEKARVKNEARSVTGVLLFTEGCFLQVLEGPTESVRELAAVIEADPRHDRMTVIIDEPIRRRSFEGWTMGFARLPSDEIREIAGINDFFAERAILDQIDEGRARKLLTAFGEGRWRVRNAGPEAVQTTAVTTQMEQMEQCVSDVAPRDVAPCPDDLDNYSFAFQPIVDVGAQSVWGHEALVRGANGQAAAAVLNHFRGDKMLRFDQDARLRALTLASHQSTQGRLAMNLVNRSLDSTRDVIGETLAHADELGFSSDRVIIEISEKDEIGDLDTFLDQIRPARAAGCQFALDDFGAGYSGLNLLAGFQPDLLKLDADLIRDISKHGPRQAIILGVVATCTDLGIEVIAEGVEDISEFQWLSHAGIGLFQGFLFARPGFECFPEPSYPTRGYSS